RLQGRGRLPRRHLAGHAVRQARRAPGHRPQHRRRPSAGRRSRSRQERAARAAVVRAIWIAAAVALAGCASSQGDGLMRRGAFAEAEAAYEAELATAPGDRALEAKRDAARTEAVRARLAQARDMRATGHGDAALSMLGEALRLETRWSLQAPPDLAAQ